MDCLYLIRNAKGMLRHPFVFKRWFNQAGMTLIEVMIALAIAATVMGAAASIIGSSTSGQMKREASRLVTLSKFLYNEATLKNQYIRLVFDLDNQKYFAETSDKPFYIIREDDEAEKIRQKNEEDNKIDSDEESADANPVPNFGEAEHDSIESYSVHSDLKIADVFIFHDKEKVTEGKAYLYFFPRGQTEFAVIHLGEQEGDDYFTLIVNPLSGAIEIRGEYIEHEDILEELETEAD